MHSFQLTPGMDTVNASTIANNRHRQSWWNRKIISGCYGLRALSLVQCFQFARLLVEFARCALNVFWVRKVTKVLLDSFTSPMSFLVVRAAAVFLVSSASWISSLPLRVAALLLPLLAFSTSLAAMKGAAVLFGVLAFSASVALLRVAAYLFDRSPQPAWPQNHSFRPYHPRILSEPLAVTNGWPP